MCDRDKYFTRPLVMDIATFSQIYSQVRPEVVSLHGYSEPLLHPKLFSLADYVKSRKGLSNITTNLIPKTDFDLLVRSSIDMVKISVDGVSAETFDAIRGKGLYEKFLVNIIALSEARQKVNYNGPIFRINFTITMHNYLDIPGVISFAAKYKIPVVYFQMLLFNYNRVNPDDTMLPTCNQQDMIELLKEGLRQAGQLHITTNIEYILANMPFSWYSYDRTSPLARSNNKRCLKPWTCTYISVDGNVKPCDLLGLNGPVMGNIMETPFESIWNGMEYQKFRRLIRLGERPAAICKHCFPSSLPEMFRYRLFGKYEGG